MTTEERIKILVEAMKIMGQKTNQERQQGAKAVAQTLINSLEAI